MKLLIPRRIWLRMQCYAEQALPNEVTGVGIIKPVVNPEGPIEALRVTDIRIAEQFTSGGYCEFAEGALNNIYLDMVEAKKEKDIPFLRFRWHSHGAGAVFFSTIDTNDIEKNNLSADWMVSLVMNVAGEKFVARLDLFSPLRISVPLETEIYDEIPSAVVRRCRLEVQENVVLLPEPAPSFADKTPARGGKQPYFRGSRTIR